MKISGRVWKLLTVVIFGECDWEIEECFGDQLSWFASDWRVVLRCGTFHFEPGQPQDNRVTLLLIFTLCPSYSSILFDLFIMNITTNFSLKKIKNYIACCPCVENTHIYVSEYVCVHICSWPLNNPELGRTNCPCSKKSAQNLKSSTSTNSTNLGSCSAVVCV